MNTYAVTGMTCEHCAAAVSSEVEAIAGVRAVSVDVQTGTLTVDGDGYTRDQLAAAVDEAGYTLA
jgi:copper chaperone